MVLRQYFQVSNCVGPAVQLKPGNIMFSSCQSISRVSQFLFGLAAISQLWQ